MKQSGIKLGTHGEQYGNWMSNPVFYTLGGVIVVTALLAILSFTVFRLPILGTILAVMALEGRK